MSATRNAQKARARALARYPDDTRTLDNLVAWTHSTADGRTIWTAVIYGHTWAISRGDGMQEWMVKRDGIMTITSYRPLNEVKRRAVEKAGEDGPPCPECGWPGMLIAHGFCCCCQKHR